MGISAGLLFEGLFHPSDEVRVVWVIVGENKGGFGKKMRPKFINTYTLYTIVYDNSKNHKDR